MLGQGGKLSTYAGVQVNGAHAVHSAEYDGQMRYFDCMLWHAGNQPQGLFALKYDNREVASHEEIMNDPYLMRRCGSEPEFAYWVALFAPEGRLTPRKKEFIDPRHMGMLLRPGESITRWWHRNGNLWIEPAAANLKRASVLVNGKVRFVPRLTPKAVDNDSESSTGLAFSDDAIAAVDRPGTVVYRMECPYMITGARAGGTFHGKAALSFSLDGKAWTGIWRASGDKPQRVMVSPGITGAFRAKWPNQKHESFTHELFFRIDLSPGSRAESLAIETDFQAYELSLPSLSRGANRVSYRDDTHEKHSVRITHEWIESGASRPPDGPVLKTPADGSHAGTQTVFEWEPVKGAAAHEFYLSPCADLAWPLLPNFHYVAGAEPRHAPAATDAFNPGQTYYWRVRARNRDGVWGAWSKTSSFTFSGPSRVPDLREEVEKESGRVLLRWGTSPKIGTKPVKFEIYGTRERGFIPLREGVVRKYNEMVVHVPPNLIATVDRPEFDITERTECFYRIAGGDKDGSRSSYGPALEVRHPRLVPTALPEGERGKPYAAGIPCILSEGNLIVDFHWDRKFNRPLKIIPWRADTPAFTLEGAPGWMTVDSKTGRISGTPDAAGSITFTVMVDGGRGNTDKLLYMVEIR